MKVTIHSPEKTEKYLVSWLEVNTDVGNFVLQKGHAPALLVIAPNKSIIMKLSNGKEETFTSQGGILQITRQEVFFIAD